MNAVLEPQPANDSFGPREEQSYSLVLIAGLVTTGLALLGVYVLDATAPDFHIMGWYANYVLPAGAIIVGVVASSGYGLASWFSGIKITRSLLWLVLVLQLAAYFAAQYIEFKSMKLIHRDGKPVGFIEYYDFTARSFAWKENDGKLGQPLGAWGYAFRGLEVLGFVGGSLLVPLILRNAPYCEACQRYMRTRQLGLIPASVPTRKIKKSDASAIAAYQTEQEQALEGGKRVWETLRQAAAASKPADFRKNLADLEPGKKATAKLNQRFGLKLVSCNRCMAGKLQIALLTGQGKQLKQTEFAHLDVHPEFVRAL